MRRIERVSGHTTAAAAVAAAAAAAAVIKTSPAYSCFDLSSFCGYPHSTCVSVERDLAERFALHYLHELIYVFFSTCICISNDEAFYWEDTSVCSVGCDSSLASSFRITLSSLAMFPTR